MIKGGKAEKIFSSYLKLLVSQSDTILDIGTSQRFAKELRPYETWFEGKHYVAGGYNPAMIYGTYNCDVHTDIENIPYEDNTWDAVICLEVLEHVANPFKAATELYRVLKPGGVLLLTTPFLLGYHGKTKRPGAIDSHSHSEYPDFWRFTHEGLFHLFKPFASTKIEVLNGPVEVGLMVFNLSSLLHVPIIRSIVDKVDRPMLSKQTSRHLVWATK